MNYNIENSIPYRFSFSELFIIRKAVICPLPQVCTAFSDDFYAVIITLRSFIF